MIEKISSPMVSFKSNMVSASPVKQRTEQDEVIDRLKEVQSQGVTVPMYAYPQMNVYAYPMAPVYAADNSQSRPYAPYMMVPQFAPVQVQPMAQYKPEVVEAKAVERQTVEHTVEQTNKETVQAVETEKKISTSEAVKEQSAVANKTVSEDVQKESAVEAKTEDVKAEPKVEIQKPEVIEAGKLNSQLDINALIAILTSEDYEEQADAMEAISQVVLYAPEKANELVDAQVVDTLVSIMNKDTSKLSDSEKPLAERNRRYALNTTSILQKYYNDEIEKVLYHSVPLDELVGMESIVEQFKTSKDAKTKEAAMYSLSYIKRPEYKSELSRLLGEAATDGDKSVSKTAQKILNDLNEI